MSMSIEEIVEETRQWPEDVVAELIDRIVIARYGGLADASAEAWGKVAQARSTEINRDPSALVPGEVVSARIRRLLDR